MRTGARGGHDDLNEQFPKAIPEDRIPEDVTAVIPESPEAGSERSSTTQQDSSEESGAEVM